MKQKKSSWLIATLVIIYLIGIAYLAFSDTRISDPAEYYSPAGMILAPDGTQLKGPTAPPPGTSPTRQVSPDGRSSGPSYAPPTPLNE